MHYSESLAAEEAGLSPDQDRRGDLRHIVTARAHCRLLGEGSSPRWNGRIRDISTLGIGIYLPVYIEPGKMLDIDLENHAGNWIGAMHARVIHAVETGSENWLLGCAFISELDDAELRYFQAEKIKPAVDDGRRWVRYACDVETVCYTCETVPGERRSAQIINVSAGGMGLLLPCEFSQGTLLRLELPMGSAQPARLLLLRVIHCIERQNRGWFLGCEFADQLGEEEIRSLTTTHPPLRRS